MLLSVCRVRVVLAGLPDFHGGVPAAFEAVSDEAVPAEDEAHLEDRAAEGRADVMVYRGMKRGVMGIYNS